MPLVQDCADRALETFGTSKIMEARVRALRLRSRVLTGLGILPVVLTGAIATVAGVDSAWLPVALGLSGILSVASALFTAVGLIADWPGLQTKAAESLAENNELYRAYDRMRKALVEDAPEEDYRVDFKYLEERYGRRELRDLDMEISDQEKRLGMRHGLAQFTRECAICGQIPVPSAPSSCAVCGGAAIQAALPPATTKKEDE